MAAAIPVATPSGSLRGPALRTPARSHMIIRVRTRLIWPSPMSMKTGSSNSAGVRSNSAHLKAFCGSSRGRVIRIETYTNPVSATMFASAHNTCSQRVSSASEGSANTSAANGV